MPVILERNILQHTLSGSLVGHDLGIGYSLNLLELINLTHQNWESMCVSQSFRNTLNLPCKRPTSLFGLLDFDAKKSLLMYDVVTKDSGLIPVILGVSGIFPLDCDTIIDNNKKFIEDSGCIYVVDDGHKELLISDLPNYILPNRVNRHYKKSHDGLKLKRIDTTLSLLDLYESTPRILKSDIETSLYYAELIDSEKDLDTQLQFLSNAYTYFHNVSNIPTATALLYPESDPSLVMYAAYYEDKFIGSAFMHIKDANWYWVNTNRLRSPSLVGSMSFNVNDAILTHLIEEARSAGAKTFNLGYDYFPYKEFYKADTVLTKKGLRYNY